MKIVGIELINHVVLGNIKCDTLGSDINSIVGRNGSGKSLLMSCLHPYGTSTRLDFVYPIKTGVSGYKKIVYSDGNTTYEVMHEYTPKGDRHSCKSYINKIVDGKVEELNPTGHNDLFKTMVKKHLHYDNDVATVCNISASNNGLISSSSKRRREIMSTIIESDKLSTMTKLTVEELRDVSSAIKILEGSKTQLLSVNGWTDRNSLDIKSVENQIKSTELRIKDVENELKLTNEQLDSVGKLDVSTIPILTLLSEVTDDKVFDVVNKYKQMKESSSLYEGYIRNLTDRESSIKEKLTMINKATVIEKDIESYLDEASKIEEILRTRFINEPGLSIAGDLRRLDSSISSIQELKSKLSITIHGNFIEERDSISEKLEELKKSVSKYEAIKADVVHVPGQNNFEKVSDICDDCVLYSKFYKNAEYIKDNESRYNKEKEEISSLAYNKEILDKILNHNVDSIDSTITNLFKKEFIEEFNISARTDTNLHDIFESLCENIERLRDIRDKLKDLRTQLNAIIVNEEENYDEELMDVERNLSEYKGKYIKATEFLKSIYSVEEKLSTSILSTPSDFMNFSKSDIMSTLTTLKTYDTTIKSLLDKKASLEEALSLLISSKDTLSDDLIKYKVALERIDTIELELREKMDEKKVFTNIKEILTKDLPIHLLSSVISFIVSSVNTILTNHKINLSIDIEVTDDNDIIIPVYTERGLVPDVSSVSSGEACLISLLINATMAHLLHYPILYIDEIDANLDEPNRVLFSQIVVSILSVFNINQIFCISHNISSDIISSTKFLIGDGEGLVLDSDVIKLN